MRVRCRLTIRSTGPIAAGRHLGYKSLAQTPARRNGPVTSNVKPHRCSSQAHQGHLNIPPNPHRDIAAHSRSKSSLPNANPNIQFCAIRLATAILPQVPGRLSPRRFGQGEARVGKKPPSAAQQLSTPPGQLASSWLALRAGVLRRAVSFSARPLVTLAAPELSAQSAHSHARHRRSFPFPAHPLQLHPKGFHCGLTRRLTGPIAAGRHLGYKSLAQTPPYRNRPVSLYVRFHKHAPAAGTGRRRKKVITRLFFVDTMKKW